MATAAVIGLTTGKRLMNTSIYSPEHSEKFFAHVDHGQAQYTSASSKTVIAANRSTNFSPNCPPKKEKQCLRVVKEIREADFLPSTVDSWIRKSSLYEEEDSVVESSLEAIVILQKSMLEKQWNLSFDQITKTTCPEGIQRTEITRSGMSARQRRNHTRRKCLGGNADVLPMGTRMQPVVSPEFQQSRTRGFIRGNAREELLSHGEVVRLSKKIKAGLSLEDHKKRLEEKLGCAPSDQQLASSLQWSCADLQSKMIECSLARERLAMNNVRLVRSIAQKYDNLGAEMADLVQGGLIGLLRGIEKYDSSKGFRISTYVYWWIRQGVSKALVDNSRTLRLPSHLHERLCSIRNAKIKLEEQGITPTLSKIAAVLNMSERKIRNATEVVSKVFSLDKEAFPSLNGLPGKTFHSYIADTRAENNPWNGFEECYVKDEVNKLLTMVLGEREQEIIRLYYGFNTECLSWEDISRQMGISRERVRQVGLVAMEKLKHAARRRRLGAILVKH